MMIFFKGHGLQSVFQIANGVFRDCRGSYTAHIAKCSKVSSSRGLSSHGHWSPEQTKLDIRGWSDPPVLGLTRMVFQGNLGPRQAQSASISRDRAAKQRFII